MSFADLSFLQSTFFSESIAKDDDLFYRNLQLWIYFLIIHIKLYELHKEIF